MTITFNYNNNEIVSSSTVIISGRTSTALSRGTIEFVNNNNKVYPPGYFEVNNNGNFKAIVHVSPNEPNRFEVKVMDNGIIDSYGFPGYGGYSPRVIDSTELTLLYNPLPQNKPIHLCVILGRDSNGSYDMPNYKLQRGEVANLDSAIRKLKIAGRLMQAYTQDQMRSTGLSNRSFQFTEETIHHQGIFGYNVDSPTPHQEVKIHVLRSPKTVAELRDPNLAQQNNNATDKGGLFSHALDLISKTPELFDNHKRMKSAIQCAVIYLDAHFDVSRDIILTHAALGGGNANIKLAIFGSHGLHSWPNNFPLMTPAFLDGTHLSKREVANDANQCGTSWECYNITLGAFMHEIGHLLGSPHQESGVMLRDYIWWNRSFMTREVECLRTKSRSDVIGVNGTWPKVCDWHILDKIRYLYHDSFSLPIDQQDDSFGKVFSTTIYPDDNYDSRAPTLYNTPNAGALVKSSAGIYLVEYITQDLARYYIPSYPKTYGGNGLQNELNLDYQQCYDELRRHSSQAKDNFDIRILSLGGDLFIKDFKNHCSNRDSRNVIKGDFGLGKGKITGYKSALLGKGQDKPEVVIGFDITTIYKIRVFHGMALDGIKFYYNTNKQDATPPVPPRNYMDKLVGKMSEHTVSSKSSKQDTKAVTMGNEKHHYTDVDIKPGDYITKMNFRNGAWMDAVQFEFSSGKKTSMMGNANGGHLSTLETPGKEFTIVGMYGYVGSWIDGLGIIYTSDL